MVKKETTKQETYIFEPFLLFSFLLFCFQFSFGFDQLGKALPRTVLCVSDPARCLLLPPPRSSSTHCAAATAAAHPRACRLHFTVFFGRVKLLCFLIGQVVAHHLLHCRVLIDQCIHTATLGLCQTYRLGIARRLASSSSAR